MESVSMRVAVSVGAAGDIVRVILSDDGGLAERREFMSLRPPRQARAGWRRRAAARTVETSKGCIPVDEVVEGEREDIVR
jgi:hypothetical protein